MQADSGKKKRERKEKNFLGGMGHILKSKMDFWPGLALWTGLLAFWPGLGHTGRSWPFLAFPGRSWPGTHDWPSGLLAWPGLMDWPETHDWPCGLVWPGQC